MTEDPRPRCVCGHRHNTDACPVGTCPCKRYEAEEEARDAGR